MTVLILGAGGPAGVNFAKSLLLKHIVCFGTDSNKYHAFMANNHMLAVFTVPPCTNKEYVDTINKIIENNHIEFVHAQPDVEVRALSENRDKINAKTFLPDNEVIKVCQDKYLSALRWFDDGLCEEPKLIEVRADLTKYELQQALDKYGKIWLRATGGAGGRGSTPCENVETGYHWIRYWRSKDWRNNMNWNQWEWVAQPYLPGRNIAWHSVWKKGKLIVSQARERLEYIYPHLAPSGITGTPSVQRTINEEKINFIAEESVLSIDPRPNGIYCVDLKETKYGRPVPTEINAGRFFTTSFFFANLGERVGIERGNMPYIYYLLGIGKEIPKGSKYNILPENIYWIRHMDIPARMTGGEEL